MLDRLGGVLMPKLMLKKATIGLDIGSSAVRAAEVVVDGDRKVLRRFAQVGLPAGAVVEGEVQDKAAVAMALKRLWQHGHFSSKEVVIGLGSQRAMVRQVEMPPISDEELRSALQFKIGEFLPIPVEQAVFDFAPLPGGDAGGRRRVLLVAAQREVVVDEVAAAEAAGLRIGAVDSSSLALLRAVSVERSPGATGPDGGRSGGLEAIVGIGAELITVAVREGGLPRFVRTVAFTGTQAGQGAGDPAPASANGDVGRRGAGKPGAVAVGVAPRLEVIVTEVRSSLEYLLSQSGTGQFERVLLTGGGAMLPGVTEALSAALGLPVRVAEPALKVDTKGLALDEGALDEASFRWLTAVGLAMWGMESYGNPSLLPPEVVERRRQRKVMAGAAAGVAVVALGLVGLSYGQARSADGISTEIASSKAQSVLLQQKITKLGYVLEIPAEVQARRALAASALEGDIDWTGLLQRISVAMPADVKLQFVTLNKTEPTSGPISLAPGSVVGTVDMTAETDGGATGVAQFIDRVSRVKGLFALWVSSTTSSTGQTTISASAQVTTAAFSTRAASLPGGSK